MVGGVQSKVSKAQVHQLAIMGALPCVCNRFMRVFLMSDRTQKMVCQFSQLSSADHPQRASRLRWPGRILLGRISPQTVTPQPQLNDDTPNPTLSDGRLFGHAPLQHGRCRGIRRRDRLYLCGTNDVGISSGSSELDGQHGLPPLAVPSRYICRDRVCVWAAQWRRCDMLDAEEERGVVVVQV